MSDKANLKYLIILSISLFLSGIFKLLGDLNPDIFLINNYLVLLLVFGPALLVTIILVLKRF